MTTVTWKEGDDGKLTTWVKKMNHKRQGHGPIARAQLQKSADAGDTAAQQRLLEIAEEEKTPNAKWRLVKEVCDADWTSLDTPTGTRYYVYDGNHETNLYMTRECAEQFIPEHETILTYDECYGGGEWYDVSTDPEIKDSAEELEYLRDTGNHTIRLSINQLNPLDEDDRYDDGYTISDEWLLIHAGIDPAILQHPGFEGGSWCDG